MWEQSLSKLTVIPPPGGPPLGAPAALETSMWPILAGALDVLLGWLAA